MDAEQEALEARFSSSDVFINRRCQIGFSGARVGSVCMATEQFGFTIQMVGNATGMSTRVP